MKNQLQQNQTINPKSFKNIVYFLDYNSPKSINNEILHVLNTRPDIRKEIERQRSFYRRNVKRNPISVNPLEEYDVFIHDDIIDTMVLNRDIENALSNEQVTLFELFTHGYTLTEISEILNVSYMTLRRNLKKIKKVVLNLTRID